MEALAKSIGIDPAVLTKLVSSLAVVGGLVLARWLVLRWIRSQVTDSDAGYRARKVSAYTVTLISALSLAFIWVDAFGSLGTYLGLLSAGIAIGLADLLKNMAGWVYILARRPFRVGDRIEMQGLKGDVIDIRLFRFSMMEVGNWVDADQSTGRLVHVPNGLVFSEQVANYTEGFSHIWDEIPVLVTFESNWDLAEEIIRDVLKEKAPDVEATAGRRIRAAARSYQLKMGALTPIVYLSARDSGILLTARYMVETRQRRSTQAAIWRGILEHFRDSDEVDLAYPTIRTYFDGPVRIDDRTS
jgi:small-conductance mechanosensitive channel